MLGLFAHSTVVICGHAEAVGFLGGPLKEGVLFGKIAALVVLTEDGYARRNEFNDGLGRVGKLQDGVRVQLARRLRTSSK